MSTTLDEMTSGLGDEDLDGFTISKAEEDTLSQPSGITVIDGKLYVVDSGNHRAVRYAGLPTEDGEVPGLVLGQDNLDANDANRDDLVGSGSLFFPMGICSGDDQHVFIADKDNHRVLIWNKIPFGNGWNADLCLGQGGMDDREPNRGEFDNVGAVTQAESTSSVVLNLSAGGLGRFPPDHVIALTGHVSIQTPHAKQSGMIRSRFSVASMTVEGQAFPHA